MSRKLTDLLPIEDGFFGIVIKWDMTTGKYYAQTEGETVSPKMLAALFEHVLKDFDDNVKEAIQEKDEGKTPPWLS